MATEPPSKTTPTEVPTTTSPPTMTTQIHLIDLSRPLGSFPSDPHPHSSWAPSSSIPPPLTEAARYLRTRDVPVAFPTETVYGLGADATRSNAVRGIYVAKGRPVDNPLIVHVSGLDMLRGLLRGSEDQDTSLDPIPEIYHSLLARFWPGPLTILLPLPYPSPLAPEVTAGLSTFGARMPSSELALTLIALAGVPLAAPSANASTRPSPTTAQHVADDLAGKVEIILDGGACAVGVESTVVDGLCEPPAILRPGGVGIEEIRRCKGWEGVVRAYKDAAVEKAEKPRAPGMKYKHYSPRARVVLYEEGGGREGQNGVKGRVVEDVRGGRRVGVVRTAKWDVALGIRHEKKGGEKDGEELGFALEERLLLDENIIGQQRSLLDAYLGTTSRSIAQGLFAALRELDRRGVDVIYVEGIRDRGGNEGGKNGGEEDGDIAAAVMNRLRKAASEVM